MERHMAASVIAGLGAGGGALGCAVSSIGDGTTTGLPFLALLAMWAIGIATTGFGVGGVVFFGLGLAELWWRDQRRRKETRDPP
jgi:hypothetical protein